MTTEKLYIETPILESTPLSRILGKPVFLKMECYQPTGSFKIRGMGALCQEWVAAGKKQLVSSSGGNAGYSAAYAARKLGVPITVIVPKTTRRLYLDQIQAEGATVKVVGEVWEDANEAAQAFVKATDAGFIPPFDHPTIWAGNSTLMDEVVHQMRQKPGAIVAAVGGGGLGCGIIQGLHRHGWPTVPFIGVETEGAASFAAAVKAKQLVTLDRVNTVATSLSAKRVAAEFFHWSQKHPTLSLTVTDKQVILACRRFADDHRVLVEPACGAALSVVYDPVAALKTVDSVLIIVCGGIGMSIDLLAEYMKMIA